MLTYTDEDHQYRWNGMKVPGVSEILQASGIVNFDHIPIDKREAGMHFGKIVHKVCQYYDEDEHYIEALEETDRDNEQKIMPYLNGWIKFKRDYNITKFVSIEQKLYSKRYNFAGRHDRIMLLNGNIILDIKTYVNSKMGGDLQLAGYSILWDENYPLEKIKERIVVGLGQNDYGITVCKNKSDRFDFLVCLQVHNLKSKRGLLK